MTGRHRLHDLRLTVTAEGIPDAVLSRLLAYFQADPNPDAAAPDLAILLQRVDDRQAPAGTRIFSHGNVRGLQLADGFGLTDASSILEISATGDRIVGRLHADSLADPQGLTHHLLFIALAVALRAHRMFHCHAAALLAPDGRGALIAGEGGSGKTTTALALLAAGWDYLGDDAVWLRERDGHVDALQVPRPFHLSPRTVEMFPDLATRLRPRPGAGDDRQELDAAEVFPGRQRGTLEDPGLLLFPRVTTEATTRIEPCAPVDAYDRLLRASALVVVDGMPHRRENLAVIERLLHGSEQLEVALGADLRTDPATLPRLLTSHLRDRVREDG